MSQTRRRMMPYAVIVGVGIVVLVLAVVFTSRFGIDPQLTASPLIGEPAPDLTLPYLEQDGEFDFAQLDGDIAVVNFWASWCLACRDEHDALLSAAEAYADLGVRFVGIDIQDTQPNATRFLTELGRGDPYIYVEDDRSLASLEYGVLGVPETFFVDREGVIVAKVSGPVNADLLNATLDAIILGRTADLGVVQTGEVENR